jgi:hypothetical protein
MASRYIFDDIAHVIACGFDESFVEEEGPQRLLVVDELSGILPYGFAFDGLIDDIVGEFDVDVVDEGVEVLVDEVEVVLGVLPGEVDVLEHLLCFQTHWVLFEMEDNYL